MRDHISIPEALSGKRVLVADREGFIAGPLVERLVQYGSKVTALVERFDRAFHVARFPVKIVRGDLSLLDDMARALEGSEIVLCFSKQNQGEAQNGNIGLEEVRNLVQMVPKMGVKRVVYTSSATPFSLTGGDAVDETAFPSGLGGVLPATDWVAEKLALDQARQNEFPVVILLPAVVYGPFCPTWTVDVLKQLKRQRLLLVDEGSGVCNPLYVDDLVEAVLRAAAREAALGEAFLISGDNPVTWRELYESYERMLAVKATVSMSGAAARDLFANHQRKVSLPRELLNILREDSNLHYRLTATRELAPLVKLAKRLFPAKVERLKSGMLNEPARPILQESPSSEKPLCLLGPEMVKFFESKTRLGIDKARRMLGFHPAVDFVTGMRKTEIWAQWANLLKG